MRRQRAWLRAWTVLAVASACALGACGASSREVVLSKPAPIRPTTTGLFAPDSVWNAQLSPDAGVDPSSARLMRRLMGEVASELRAQRGPWIETAEDSTPIYRVPADEPQVPVKLENSEPWARTLEAALEDVPIPPGARQAVGSDGHLTVWQPSTDRMWELWRAVKKRDGWHARWGGAMEHVSRNPGYYTSTSWPGAKSYWGSTATSLPMIAGTITIAELERGSIDHALAIDLPSVRANAYAWPAQRTDGEDPRPDAIPEGAKLRIDPHLDIARLHLPPMTREMALAAQRYGMIVRDQTHHAIGFYAEDPTPTHSRPYPAFMRYEAPWQMLAGFPWKHVEVLRMDLRHGTGRPASL